VSRFGKDVPKPKSGWVGAPPKRAATTGRRLVIHDGSKTRELRGSRNLGSRLGRTPSRCTADRARNPERGKAQGRIAIRRERNWRTREPGRARRQADRRRELKPRSRTPKRPRFVIRPFFDHLQVSHFRGRETDHPDENKSGRPKRRERHVGPATCGNARATRQRDQPCEGRDSQTL